jgi:hypothetical protein
MRLLRAVLALAGHVSRDAREEGQDDQPSAGTTLRSTGLIGEAV